MSASQPRRPNTGPALKAPPARAGHCALSEARGLARRPKDFHWVERNIPCQAACPARTDIPGYLDAIARGDFDGAYRINLMDNVFPAVLGRVCTRPCEPACRHGWAGLGEPVAICFSKRSAADFQQRAAPVVLDKLFPPTGKSVAIVGGGAAGLAAARDLALWGHRVVVLERDARPGGMMAQGIPDFRLPRAVVELEIEQIRLLGVEIRCGAAVASAEALEALRRAHDAVLLAAGAAQPFLPDWPGVGTPGVEHGLTFLRRANRGSAECVGSRVVVIGGGFTAVDCARMAKRLGAAEVGLYYRRTAAEMYIAAGEVEELLREGISFQAQTVPTALRTEGGRVAAVRFERTEPGPPGSDGRRGFRLAPASAFDVPADIVLTATGQRADRGWLPGAWAARIADANAGVLAVEPGVFAVGDFAAGARSLIEAIADGRAGARAADRFLMGRERLLDAVRIEDAAATGRTREMDAWPREPMPALPPERRAGGLEVDTGFDPERSQREARRCYLCHFKYEIDNELCIYCDRCLKVKPVERCIVKVSSLLHDEYGRITGYHESKGARDYNLLYIDQSQCIRCGACKEVCPVECIDLQKVSRVSCAAGEGAER